MLREQPKEHLEIIHEQPENTLTHSTSPRKVSVHHQSHSQMTDLSFRR